tara:strand:+ start:610 stop:1017 length:408 start_codon:yes stop_codon:yes gene_type:complete
MIKNDCPNCGAPMDNEDKVLECLMCGVEGSTGCCNMAGVGCICVACEEREAKLENAGATDIEKKAYRVVEHRGPISCADIGWELWGETTPSPMRGEGSHNHNKFCRAAGRIMNSLQDKGLACHANDPYRVTWRIR